MDGMNLQEKSLISFVVTKKSKLAFGYCDYTADGQPFYVGIGNRNRVRLQKRNKKHTNVANKHGFHRVIEFCALAADYKTSYRTACQWEIDMISQQKTFHESSNLGCNFTKGGEGNKGGKPRWSKRSREKLSDTQKLRYHDPAEHTKTSDAIKRAKADPIKLANHAKGQQVRYSDSHNRHCMHETNTQKKRVQQFTLDGVFIKEFPSMSYAVAETGIQNIKRVAWGKRKSAGGFIWKYIDEKETP